MHTATANILINAYGAPETHFMAFNSFDFFSREI